ncbi:hypothetical protein ACFRAE_06455 [Sphingobacterium sp. HJSM2_6]|uniref:hypothetical protein n=1 Tax=Sphingobacterium sp. HJSM2_6 TaxID=3366264 RepID=UPI003BC05E7C
MKLLRAITLLTMLCCTAPIFAQSSFEGTLTSRVTMAGVDLSLVTEQIDYSKGNVQEQMQTLFKAIPPADFARLRAMMEENPMMGIAMIMMPPKASIHIKNKITYAKTKGLGYEIQHYHNEQSDEAFLYTASLIKPSDAVTGAYKPSEGYDALFTEANRITVDKFNVERSTKTAQVAGYTCNISTYTTKSLDPETPNSMGIPSVQVHKLVVYTSKELPKGINFSHPYYLPEDHGILRIDIYLNAKAEPSMVYEMTAVDKSPVNDSLLIPKKSEPIYTLTDMNYAMKLMGIMMGGMAQMDVSDENEEEFSEDEEIN